MILTYTIVICLVLSLNGCTTNAGIPQSKVKIIHIIEKSIGKSVEHFFMQLQNNSWNLDELIIKSMQDEEFQEFGIELKIPESHGNIHSEIIIRVRFDLRKMATDSLPNDYTVNSQKLPAVVQRNQKYEIEFIRVLEYKDNKIIYNKIYDKSTGFYVLPTADVISNRKLKYKK